MSRAERRALIDREAPALPVSRQCRLLSVSRASVYRRPAEINEEDCAIMALIDRQYLARPYYGSRRMAAWLATQGHVVNRKRVRRLMRLAGLAAIYQRPNTSKPAPAHKIYPYLLGGIAIERVNQVWCADVTYIPMAKGFLYLVVIMDWVSRAVLAWRLSNTLGAEFCVEALEEALARHGQPAVFNTDQGSQFTSDDFTGTLQNHAVTISMDGKSLPSRKRGAATWTTSSSSGCGAASNTRRSTSTPMPASPRPRPASAHGSSSITRSASTRAWAIVPRAKSTKQNARGYVDDRLRRPAAPSPTFPPAQPPTTGWILTTRNTEAMS
jgi:Integrase core domain/HTH-like domain